MIIEQRIKKENKDWELLTAAISSGVPQLVLVFGCREMLEDVDNCNEVRSMYPKSDIVFSSTSGEITNQSISENSMVASALYFEKTEIKVWSTNLSQHDSSYMAAKSIAHNVDLKGLSNVLIFSDGHIINGDEVILGLNSVWKDRVKVTGGMAGDSNNFEKTLVGLNDICPREGEVVLVGFYGENLKIGHGSRGGWDPFGPEREITRSEGNVLHELDGQSALELYKLYLGEKADELPMSALFFPLSIQLNDYEGFLVRTILQIDQENNTMTFAGDMPEGAKVRLMKSNFDRLIDGAVNAAKDSYKGLMYRTPDFALLISCVGRKLIMGQRTEEEIEEIRLILGDSTVLAGFYSYGEICPSVRDGMPRLHNQTMTITTFVEE